MLSFKKHFTFEPTAQSEAIMQEAMDKVTQEMLSDEVGYYKLPTHSLKHIERLKENNLFQEVILSQFIEKQRLALTKGFKGDMDDVEALKAIAFFESWLDDNVEQAKIIRENDIINKKG